MSGSAGRVLRMSYLVASVAGVAFFAMSVLLLGVWPERVLRADMGAMSPPGYTGLTPGEARGRAIYAREGCAYCHTQQVRYLDADMMRFGAPTLAWETRFDYPQLWGTRRIGPDLARESGNRPDDWQFAHLYAPRAIAPLSVMPASPWLFDGAPDRPGQDARDLVAYLATLGRARELAAPEGEARALAACRCDDDPMAMMAFDAPALNASPARARRAGVVPPMPASGDRARGDRLFADYCAGCHGAAGRGDGAAGLHPRPSNLAGHRYARARLADSLWNGVAGTSMPAWRDLPPSDLAALMETVQAFGAAASEPGAEPAMIDAGARVYAANCVPCHGDRGDGQGFAARALGIAPTNFLRQQPGLAIAVRAIRSGVEGTPMAPWTSRLDEVQMIAVAHYVRSLYRNDARQTGGSR
jgi:cbb3-type cytochrome oxidase cytochrome c subunit/cytochrome c5